jgi:hypothetical protein
MHKYSTVKNSASDLQPANDDGAEEWWLELQNLEFEASDRSAANRPKMLTGRRLNRLIKQGSPADRALLAHEIERGTTQIHRPTRAHAAALTQVSPSDIATVARLSEDERLQLARGELSLSDLHRRHRQVLTFDERIDRVIAKFGAEAILTGLDRATAPANGG